MVLHRAAVKSDHSYCCPLESLSKAELDDVMDECTPSDQSGFSNVQDEMHQATCDMQATTRNVLKKHVTPSDHTYCLPKATVLKNRVLFMMKRLEHAKKTLNSLTQRKGRLQKRVSSLQDIITHLREKQLLSDEGNDALESISSSCSTLLVKRCLRNAQAGNISCKKFPAELRVFAMTLQFYSTKAYNYVRKKFDFGLPHISTIRDWYSCINGDPGFTAEAFHTLKKKVNEEKSAGRHVLCSLLLDEVHIKKSVEWNGKRYVGYVDLGIGTDDDSSPPATEALVFMVVAVNSNWKCTIGYFLVNGLPGKEKANLVATALTKLHAIGIDILSLTCDGPNPNFTMLCKLGAKIGNKDVDPTFMHPTSGQKCVAFLDVVHMMKLLWNSLASYQHFVGPDGRKISWRYIDELHKLQEEEGL